jgi:CBS domain-containing protein
MDQLMRVRQIMTDRPASCCPDQSLEEAARIMLTHDCGAVPVCEDGEKRVVGVITDRDIAIRAVATGKDARKLRVRDVMSHPVATVPAEASVDDCVKLMEENQVRRAPVVDEQGRLVGMVAQADVARTAPPLKVAGMVQEVSKGPELGHIP